MWCLWVGVLCVGCGVVGVCGVSVMSVCCVVVWCVRVSSGGICITVTGAISRVCNENYLAVTVTVEIFQGSQLEEHYSFSYRFHHPGIRICSHSARMVHSAGDSEAHLISSIFLKGPFSKSL